MSGFAASPSLCLPSPRAQDACGYLRLAYAQAETPQQFPGRPASYGGRAAVGNLAEHGVSCITFKLEVARFSPEQWCAADDGE